MNFEKEPETPPTRKSLKPFSDIMRVVVATLLIVGGLYSAYTAVRTSGEQDCYAIDHNRAYSYLSDGKHPAWFVKVAGTHVETGERKWLHTTAPEIIGHTQICEPADKNFVEAVGMVLISLVVLGLLAAGAFVGAWLIIYFIGWLLNKPL